MLIASIAAFFGVFILMTTPLGTVFGWGIPIFIICLGLAILRKGFPTSESLQRTVNSIIKRFSKNKSNDLDNEEFQNNFKEPVPVQNEEIQGFIKPYSRLFYILAIILGIFVGFNNFKCVFQCSDFCQIDVDFFRLVSAKIQLHQSDNRDFEWIFKVKLKIFLYRLISFEVVNDEVYICLPAALAASASASL